MSRICQLTGKKSQRGKKVTLAWGVKYSSIKHRKPNLRHTTLLVDGEPVRVLVSARALKSVKNGKYPGLTTIASTKVAQKPVAAVVTPEVKE